MRRIQANLSFVPIETIHILPDLLSYVCEVVIPTEIQDPLLC